MKIILSLTLLAFTSAAALAGACDGDLAKVDAALTTTAVPPDQRNQVKDMREQAAQLCGAGNEQEGLDVLTEAKSMLAIE